MCDSKKFDIVICVGPNDVDIVNSVVFYSKKNILEYRNIYLICQDPSIKIENTITIDEKIFPFSIDDVSKYHGKRNRNGWYLQQLLKMYAGKVIPGILQKYLVIDCDTHFLKLTKFLTDDNKQYLTTGTEYHVPYFIHMNKLHPSLSKVHPLSGISHHTFFDTKIMDSLIELVELYHKESKKVFWEIFLVNVDSINYDTSGSAENELYFTYAYIYHSDKIKIRELDWKNVNKLDLNTNCDFLSVHWYLR
jgi:hypothetical protein